VRDTSPPRPLRLEPADRREAGSFIVGEGIGMESKPFPSLGVFASDFFKISRSNVYVRVYLAAINSFVIADN